MVVRKRQSQGERISVLQELLEKRDKVQRKLDEIVAGLKGEDGTVRDPSPEETEKSNELLEKRDRLDARIEQESHDVARQNMLTEARRNAGVQIEQRNGGTGSNGANVSVEREPMIYGFGARNSYFADMYYLAKYRPGDPLYDAAWTRRQEYSAQIEREIHDGTKFGAFAEKQFREHYRAPAPDQSMGAAPGQIDWKQIYRECRDRGSVAVSERTANVESRAITTGGGATASASGGGAAAFVTPIFTESDYVPFREFGRVFADETTKRPLPDYGMAIYMPQITSGAQVSTNYETSPGETGSVPESDPAQGYITAGLIITAGQVTTSQAVLDRTGPNFEYDVVIWDQLERDYAQKWDAYVIKQALANAQSQSWSGNSNAFVLSYPSGNGAGGFVGQVAKAAAYMESLSGTVLSPNHLFLIPARWRFITAWNDGSERPVVVPQPNGPFNAWAAANGNPALIPEGNTGFCIGGLPVHTDNNIPLQGTTTLDQAVVTDSQQTWSYEGTPVHRVLPQTLGGNLEVIFQQYSYGTVLQRYAGAVVVITGSGLSAISYQD